MIFEVKRFRAKLLGEQGKRIINILLETCATKGVVSAEFEEAAAGQVGLVRLLPEDAEPSLKESFLRYYFAKGMSVEDVCSKRATGEREPMGWLCSWSQRFRNWRKIASPDEKNRRPANAGRFKIKRTEFSGRF